MSKGAIFKFSTFGFPVLTAPVEEFVEPTSTTAGRVAWSAELDGSEEEKVGIYHAWLVEDLDGGRVRILTQESQWGKPAAKLAAEKPNKMVLGHQDWIEGLVRAVRGESLSKETNLSAIGFHERGDDK